MKTFLKVILWLFVGFIGLIVLFYIIGSSGNDDREERLAKLEEKHCQTTYQESDNKAKLLSQVINEPSINSRQHMGIIMGDLLKNSVKYPSTLEVDGDKFSGYLFLNKKNAINVDTTAGTWTYVVNFRSQNTLSQMVRSQMRLDMKYEASCNSAEIINFTLN